MAEEQIGCRGPRPSWPGSFGEMEWGIGVRPLRAECEVRWQCCKADEEEHGDLSNSLVPQYAAYEIPKADCEKEIENDEGNKRQWAGPGKLAVEHRSNRRADNQKNHL